MVNKFSHGLHVLTGPVVQFEALVKIAKGSVRSECVNTAARVNASMQFVNAFYSSCVQGIGEILGIFDF